MQVEEEMNICHKCVCALCSIQTQKYMQSVLANASILIFAAIFSVRLPTPQDWRVENLPQIVASMIVRGITVARLY